MGKHLSSLSLSEMTILLKVHPALCTISFSILTIVSQVVYFGNIPYLMIVSMTKTSILLFYLRLFGTPGTYKGYRKLIYVTQALVVAWLVGSLIPGILRCHPIADTWHPLVVEDPGVRAYCINDGAYYVASSAFNVALDFWILALPLPIVWKLQLSKFRKVSLIAIFLLGGLYGSCPTLAAVHLC